MPYHYMYLALPAFFNLLHLFTFLCLLSYALSFPNARLQDTISQPILCHRRHSEMGKEIPISACCNLSVLYRGSTSPDDAVSLKSRLIFALLLLAYEPNTCQFEALASEKSARRVCLAKNMMLHYSDSILMCHTHVGICDWWLAA